MNLPEDRPHGRARGLVRRNTITVHPQGEVPGVGQEVSLPHQVPVYLAILNVSDEVWVRLALVTIRQSVEESGIFEKFLHITLHWKLEKEGLLSLLRLISLTPLVPPPLASGAPGLLLRKAVLTGFAKFMKDQPVSGTEEAEESVYLLGEEVA